MEREDIPAKSRVIEGREEEIHLDWKDYIAFYLAFLQTVFLPFILFIVALLVFVLILMVV